VEAQACNLVLIAGMSAAKRNSGHGPVAEAEPLSVDLSGVEELCRGLPSVEELCGAIAKAFHVKRTEVALLRREGDALKFLFPRELRDVGSIPLSSSAVAAHTATTKKVDLFNRFTRVKHASVFEGVRLGLGAEGEDRGGPIQKLMSAPILDSSHDTIGVIQICRKGSESCLAGPDFNRIDLRQLESVARLVADLNVLWSEAAAH
jgi:hypothetical protein